MVGCEPICPPTIADPCGPTRGLWPIRVDAWQTAAEVYVTPLSGHGTGEEYSQHPTSTRGSYRPIWLDVHALANYDIRPQALACALADGTLQRITQPLHIQEPQLREAIPADADILRDLLIQSFIEYEGRLDPPTGVYAETVASLAKKLNDGGALVCEIGGIAVGCIFYAPKDGYLYVGRLAVIPAYRHRNIATLLLDAAEQRARDLGFARVRLGVRLVLTKLRAYYETRAYVPITFHAHAGYNEPTYVEMERSLN